MFKFKPFVQRHFKRAVMAGVAACAASSAFATAIPHSTIKPAIQAGLPPDSSTIRIDPNLPSSAFSGVVSINILYNNQSFICSGALVGKRSVVSAGHCVDTNGNGAIIDVSAPGNAVRVVFNSAGDLNAIIDASKVAVDPDFAGFGVCPPGVNSFCVNDDLAVITLSEDAPASAKVYSVALNPVTAGTQIVVAGYGPSGDGISGYTVPPSFNVKRSGGNVIDLFDADDEQNFSGANEVFYADFDGNGQDSFCTQLGICSQQLPNGVETTISSGDSGGPAFVLRNGELVLVGNTSFTGAFDGQADGTFGTYFGGILLSSYGDFLQGATAGDVGFVPEPGSAALLGLGACMLAGLRRRSRKGA